MIDIVDVLRGMFGEPTSVDLELGAQKIERLRALLFEIAVATDPRWGRTLARRELKMEDNKTQVEKALDGELPLFEWMEKQQGR